MEIEIMLCNSKLIVGLSVCESLNTALAAGEKLALRVDLSTAAIAGK